jgi:hypothetical protein
MLTIFQASSSFLQEKTQVAPPSDSPDLCAPRARQVTVAESPPREMSQEPNANGAQRLLYAEAKRATPCRIISSSLAGG